MRLESVWPEVSRRLDWGLRKKGVQPADRDEIIQETAARALASQPQFVDADDLLRWATVVSRRVAVDNWRHNRRVSDAPVPERAATADVARTVEARMALHVVSTAMKQLSDDDRAAIGSGLHSHVPADRTTEVRDGVRRFRARNRLRALSEGLVAWLGWLVGARRLRRSGGPRLATIAAPSVMAVALLFVPVMMPGGPGHRSAQASPPVGKATGRGPIRNAEPALRLTAVDAPSHAIQSVPRSTSPALPPAGAKVGTPTGKPAILGERPGSGEDPLLCVKPLSPTPTCVDPPLPHVNLP
jgi:hypothetical protein